jgi:hypothetical protein
MATPLKVMTRSASRVIPARQEVVMMRSEHTNRKPDTLLALLVTLGIMLTSTAAASELVFSKPDFADLQDGDVTLARSDRSGAGVHMSFMSPSLLGGSSQSSHVVSSSAGTLPNVYLSLRLPW